MPLGNTTDPLTAWSDFLGSIPRFIAIYRLVKLLLEYSFKISNALSGSYVNQKSNSELIFLNFLVILVIFNPQFLYPYPCATCNYFYCCINIISIDIWHFYISNRFQLLPGYFSNFICMWFGTSFFKFNSFLIRMEVGGVLTIKEKLLSA